MLKVMRYRAPSSVILDGCSWDGLLGQVLPSRLDGPDNEGESAISNPPRAKR
jgi:hypothetical protein